MTGTEGEPVAQYPSQEQARKKWAQDHQLPVEMAPEFPEGTRQYAQNRQRLDVELKMCTNGFYG